MRGVVLLCFAFLTTAASAQDASGVVPAAIVSYDAGHSAAIQFVQQDSNFAYDRFLEGFEAGFEGDSSQIAFAIGLRIGLSMSAEPSGTVDVEQFLQGMRHGLDGAEPRFTAKQVTSANRSVQDSVMIGRLRADAASNPEAAAQLELVVKNGEASAAFLAEVATRPGVQRTDSGVLYVVSEPGAGSQPDESSVVSVHYAGRFPDGTEFDRSEDETPTTFSVQQMVPGFAEMLVAMKPGESRTIFIPPSQAFGMTGTAGPGGQGGVPPNTALVFDLTLVGVADG